MKLAVLDWNWHRHEIITVHNNKLGRIVTRWSRSQSRYVQIFIWPPPSLNFKSDIMRIARNFYADYKESRIKERMIGRPKKIVEEELPQTAYNTDSDSDSDRNTDDDSD